MKGHSEPHFENENMFSEIKVNQDVFCYLKSEIFRYISNYVSIQSLILTIIFQGAEVPFYIWYDDYPEHASQEYKGRVSKVPLDGQGQSGLASLILSEVKDTDRGWYNCKVLFLNREPNNAVVSA